MAALAAVRSLCAGGGALCRLVGADVLFAAEDGLRVGLLVVLVVLIVLVVIVRLFLAAEQNVQDENEAEHRDEDIGHVEHGEVEQFYLEHVLNIAVENAVDAVGQAARDHQHRAPAPDGAGDEVGSQRDDNAHGKDAADNDKVYPRAASAEEAERRAVVMDVDEADDTGDKLLYAHAHAEVACYPILHPLVEDYDQHSYYCIQHIVLLSAAGKPAARDLLTDIFRPAHRCMPEHGRAVLITVLRPPPRSAGRDRSRGRPARSASSSGGISRRGPR